MISILIVCPVFGQWEGWLHLTVSLPGCGFPIGRQVQSMARMAERGMLDAVWLEGGGVDPLPLLGSLIAVTSRIGLGAHWGVEHAEPYNVARVFATLDHLAGGRTAWLAGFGGDATANFGHAPALEAGASLARAGELIDVVRKLWDSWEDEGFLLDVGSGRFADPSRVHPIEHVGAHFSVRGPLNVPRPVQGNPVVAMIWPEGAARRLVAGAEVVLADCAGPEEARAVRRELEPGERCLLVEVRPELGRGAEPVLAGIAAWEGCCEGVNVRFGTAGELEWFVDAVVPLGQARGLFRRAYEGTTLREHLGLGRPRSRFAA